MTDQFGRSIRTLFALDENIVHLNHGSYGATPRAILEFQHKLRLELEREPSNFMHRRAPTLSRRAAKAAATIVQAKPDQIGMIENATMGVNTVLSSLSFTPGDEILITNQTYGAVRNAVVHVGKRTGASIVTITLPFPKPDEAAILDAFREALGEKTKLVIVDHVTSATALVLPVSSIIAMARKVGAITLVDGAHAPGMLEINVENLDCDFYTANCHKWLCAPKGCAFLWSAYNKTKLLHPVVISHGYGSGLSAEFDWTGTRDATAQFVLPEAISFLDQFGLDAIRAYNHHLATTAANFLKETWNTQMGAENRFFGSMAMVELPILREATQENAQALRWHLFDEHAIQVPIHALSGRLWVRISAQIYNEMSDYESLSSAIKVIAKSG